MTLTRRRVYFLRVNEHERRSSLSAKHSKWHLPSIFVESIEVNFTFALAASISPCLDVIGNVSNLEHDIEENDKESTIWDGDGFRRRAHATEKPELTVRDSCHGKPIRT